MKWSPADDNVLLEAVQKHGERWRKIKRILGLLVSQKWDMICWLTMIANQRR